MKGNLVTSKISEFKGNVLCWRHCHVGITISECRRWHHCNCWKMVEETINNANKPKVKTTNNKPKSVYSWTVADVQKWLRRHCTDYYASYADKFSQNDITGRTLIRINDNSLLRLGIVDVDHREAIWREILKLRLKTDIMEIRDLQRRNTNNMFYEYSIA